MYKNKCWLNIFALSALLFNPFSFIFVYDRIKQYFKLIWFYKLSTACLKLKKSYIVPILIEKLSRGYAFMCVDTCLLLYLIILEHFFHSTAIDDLTIIKYERTNITGISCNTRKISNE